ncbi:2,3-bisphosphoglycerate-independent phosphoglycerate mutase [Micractinium conductrix]|uniref:phosphoglycerate mutase (2,3-diphosphoglycerate-independent) n=1 Tax=Micractinium conductrix TaxID=554055 RepID=A0A2P6V7M8_9CHLO|nr:2,3-bisphosphoglycerate-independent phosphoglycerate mutase [Micractinium conductrix]|eukprot:PSC70092.1 2,3-bisphosphoglycerate-independent phosphoglycerate mutase [Micractinium conductrix]
MSSFQLQPHSTLQRGEGPLLVCILDGFGENSIKDDYNAIHVADTPCTDALRAVPGRFRTIRAHGTAVGLPSDDDMGNSEVGHNALGAGQLIDQGASLVDNALRTGSLFTGAGWEYIAPSFAENTLHFIGLLSDGGVHSRTDQLHGCVRGAAERGAKKIRLHILTDGRDVPDGSSLRFVAELEALLQELQGQGVDAKIASGGGRMGVTMDRYEADWNIVKKGWEAHVLGEAPHYFKDALTAIKTLRKDDSDKPVSDQWLDPFVIVGEDNTPVGTVQDGDAVVIFNFRADRVIELSKALEYAKFDKFDRKRWPQTRFVGLMQYDGDLKLPTNYLVPPPAISGTSGEYLAKNGLRTFVCSETQKFGHVTFFWNGNRSGYFNEDLETYVEIPSDTVPFNEIPEMKAREICEAGKEALRSGKYDQVRINFANPDMVGHTGDLAATVSCCALVDQCVKELLEVVDEVKGRFLLTSDHGNADDMAQRDKKTKAALVHEGKVVSLTSHTLAPVPLFIGGAGLPDTVKLSQEMLEAGLGNVAACVFNLMGFQAPQHMLPSLLTFE